MARRVDPRRQRPGGLTRAALIDISAAFPRCRPSARPHLTLSREAAAQDATGPLTLVLAADVQRADGPSLLLPHQT